MIQYNHLLPKKNKTFNETKTMIKKLKTQAPVLSTIVNYGGEEPVNDHLSLEHSLQSKQYNEFIKILKDQQSSFDQGDTVKKNHPSFINYVSSPRKQKIIQLSPKATKRKSLKSSIVVEMPKQLKDLKNEVLSLPSIARVNQLQSQELSQQKQVSHNSLLSSHLMESYSTKKERFKTDTIIRKKKQNKEHYRKELSVIMSKFNESSEERQNYLSRQRQFMKLLKKQAEIQQKFKRLQLYGNPPQKIVDLLERVSKFQKNVDESLDQQLLEEVRQMDSKKFDRIIKYENDMKKIGIAKYQQQTKKQKIQESKNQIGQQAAYKDDTRRFKLNSKGKQVYNYKKK